MWCNAIENHIFTHTCIVYLAVFLSIFRKLSLQQRRWSDSNIQHHHLHHYTIHANHSLHSPSTITPFPIHHLHDKTSQCAPAIYFQEQGKSHVIYEQFYTIKHHIAHLIKYHISHLQSIVSNKGNPMLFMHSCP